MNAIAAASRARISECDTKRLANTAWAFAKLEVDHHPLLEALSAEARAKIHDLQSQECSNIAWAVASLVFFDSPLM